MGAIFSIPAFDAEGVKTLSRAGSENDMMMDIRVYKMRAGEERTFLSHNAETAALLVLGRVSYIWEDRAERAARKSFIDEGPYCLHVPRAVPFTVKAELDSELIVQSTANERDFASVFYSPADCRDDIFGKGTLDGKCERTVRTVFDYNNAPYSNMVCGEVINHQGGWSSYVPHSPPQPEVYYYRYERPEGFGACFIGDEAFKITDGACANIPGGKTHPQVTAPAYPMYYCWMIRHLPGNPWTDRVVDERYAWIEKTM